MSISRKALVTIVFLLGLTASASAQVVANPNDCPGATHAKMACGGADDRASCYYHCVANPTTPGATGCPHQAVAPNGGYKKKMTANNSPSCR